MDDYQRIEKAIHYIESHLLEQPSLAEIAKAVHLSEFHFQRTFSRWAGISPKRFLRYLTADFAKKKLRESRSVLDASLDLGLSSPSRMHDLMITVEAMTPGEYKALGRGLTIEYGTHPSPFGDCLVALSPRGLCGLAFDSGLEQLRENWPDARFKSSQARTAGVVRQIFGTSRKIGSELKVLLKGSRFQVKVWEALLNIPQGRLASYKDVAGWVGAPGAARAVGTAVAKNQIAFLIPCHRVIRESGVVGQYRWGSQRKKAMIAWEA